jgi:hypothetical protein
MTTILDTLIAQAKSAVGQSFLAAGVIPALLLLLGWQLYASGLAQLRSDLAAFLQDKPSAIAAGSVFYGVVAVAVGGLFFTGRSLSLRLLQKLPGGLLSVFRHLLLKSQRRRWNRIQERRFLAEKRYTPLGWASTGQFDEQAVVVWEGQQAIEDALARSKAGRDDLIRLRDDEGRTAKMSDAQRLADDLDAFYRLPPGDACTRERDCWSKLFADHRVEALLKQLAQLLLDDMQRRTEDAHEMPDDWRWLAPTRLGNRAVALDDYSARRYNITTTTLWARLSPLLDDTDKASVGSAQLTVETLANLTIASLVLATAIAVRAILSLFTPGSAARLNDWHAIGLVAACVALALVAYRSAAFAFDAMAERIVCLVDLHRLRVIEAIGFKSPETVGQEMATFSELEGFFNGSAARDPSRQLVSSTRRTPSAPPGNRPAALAGLRK